MVTTGGPNRTHITEVCVALLLSLMLLLGSRITNERRSRHLGEYASSQPYAGAASPGLGLRATTIRTLPEGADGCEGAQDPNRDDEEHSPRLPSRRRFRGEHVPGSPRATRREPVLPHRLGATGLVSWAHLYRWRDEAHARNTFAWISHNRRMGKDHERLCSTGEAFVYAAMTRLMLRRLAHG